MHAYQFRFPVTTPRLTYTRLARLLRTCWYPMASGEHYAKIGETVRIRWHGGQERSEHAALPSAVQLELYGLRIAKIMPGAVYFPGPDDPHTATTEWIAKIIRDNGIGDGAGRIRRHKADGPGSENAHGRAGLLCIGYDRQRPVFGHSYPLPLNRQETGS